MRLFCAKAIAGKWKTGACQGKKLSEEIINGRIGKADCLHIHPEFDFDRYYTSPYTKAYSDACGCLFPDDKNQADYS
ncbi:hypothetical protein N8Q87_25330, partial [Enterobacter hormaechei subsp. steigerwaltii]|nr:hypothetical protein [Enterobacter hormaechei subsp. steigerwaltii]MCU2809617.1 hypothetical protein [Enterobacter hormaechei subsp. steigerwaltii]MCU3905839.1 hypothetical protein [Enterobacter hormaechei subsp. steigerwaltii]